MFKPLVLHPRQNPAVSRYENTSGKHNKFWEVSSVGSRLTTHWGRIGTKGQTKSKSFQTAREATYAGLKMIEDKLDGGYHNVRPGQGAAARPVEKKPRVAAKVKPKSAKKVTRASVPAKGRGKLTAATILTAVRKAGIATARTMVEADTVSTHGAWRVTGLKKPLKQKETDFLYGTNGWAARHGVLVGGRQEMGELYLTPRDGKKIVHKKIVPRGAAFEKALASMKAQLNALPRPKTHFMEGGDGYSGYGWVSLPGVKRDIIAGPDEWNARTVTRAEEIVKQHFGPGARFRVNVD